MQEENNKKEFALTLSGFQSVGASSLDTSWRQSCFTFCHLWGWSYIALSEQYPTPQHHSQCTTSQSVMLAQWRSPSPSNSWGLGGKTPTVPYCSSALSAGWSWWQTNVWWIDWQWQSHLCKGAHWWTTTIFDSSSCVTILHFTSRDTRHSKNTTTAKCSDRYQRCCSKAAVTSWAMRVWSKHILERILVGLTGLIPGSRVKQRQEEQQWEKGLGIPGCCVYLALDLGWEEEELEGVQGLDRPPGMMSGVGRAEFGQEVFLLWKI